MIEEFPNLLEKNILEHFIELLKKNRIKFSKQKFERGLKIYVKSDYSRITFHIYNVEDVAK